MKFAKFPCGCTIPMTDDGKLNLEIDWDNFNYNCKATWDLISEGNTKGLFQLESRFGRQLCKQARVDSLEEYAAVTAILRPGCSEASMEDENGKKKILTYHYLDRKDGRDKVTYFHPSLEPILKNTYGILVYQEQAMRIATELAGFTLMEADELRKAAGKKKADLMAKIKIKFIEGCKKMGVVNEKEAEEIWGWIEKSQRYSFNASHAVGYAYVGYVTAYLKQHRPLEMFTGWLRHSKDKGGKNAKEEMAELIANAKSMDIEVRIPDFRHLNKHFNIYDDRIYFGFVEVADVGEAAYEKLRKVTKELEDSIGPREKWTYMDVMMGLLMKIGSKVAQNLISVGAFEYISNKRARMLYEYNHICQITEKPLEWCMANYRNYSSVTAMMKACVNEYKFKQPASKNKLVGLIDAIENPPYSLLDTAESIAGEEKRLLTVALTCSKVDGCENAVNANCTCKEFLKGRNGYCMVAVSIDSVKETSIKKADSEHVGKRMAFLTVSDDSGTLDRVVAFPEAWGKTRGILTTGNTVILGGQRSRKNGDDSFIVEKAWQL